MKLPNEPSMRTILRFPDRADEFHDLLTVHHGRKMLNYGALSAEDAKTLAFELGVICGKRDWQLPVQKEYAPRAPLRSGVP